MSKFKKTLLILFSTIILLITGIIALYNFAPLKTIMFGQKTAITLLDKIGYRLEIGLISQGLKDENGKNLLVLNDVQITDKSTLQNIVFIKNIQIKYNFKDLFKLGKLPIFIKVTKGNFVVKALENQGKSFKDLNIFGFFNYIPLVTLKKVEFENFEIILEQGKKKIPFKVSEIDINFFSSKQFLSINLNYLVNGKKYNSDISFSAKNNRFLNVSATLNNFPVSYLINNFSEKIIFTNHNSKDFSTVFLFHSFDKLSDKSYSQISFQDLTGYISSKANPTNKILLKNSACSVNFINLNSFKLNYCNLDIDSNSNLKMAGIINIQDNLFSIKSSGLTKNINLDHLETLSKILAWKDFEKLKSIIPKANIDLGKWEFQIPKLNLNKIDLSNNDIQASFKISETDINYDPEHPIVENIKSEIKINGLEVTSNINAATIGNSKILSGLVKFNLSDYYENGINLELKAEGEAKDYLRYLNQEELAEIEEKNVQLDSLSGSATSLIKILIHPNPNIPNKIDIKSNLTNVKFNSFDNQVNFYFDKLNATLSREQLKIFGWGKINNLQSFVNFVHTKLTKTEVENKLTIKSLLSREISPNAFLNITAGATPINLNYFSKNDIGELTIKGNLKNIEFSNGKIGFLKPLGQSAVLEISNKFTSNDPGVYYFRMVGKNLSVDMNILEKDNKNLLVIKNATFNNSNLKGTGEFSKSLIDLNLHGPVFDTKFFTIFDTTSHSEIENLKLKLNFDELILKNNIKASSFDLNLECNSKSCYKGTVNSYIDKNQISGNIHNYGNFEEIIFRADNAGKVLKGLNIYQNLKGGDLILGFKVERLNSAQNYISGDIKLEKFQTLRTPFLTKIISFVSIPGFLNMVMQRSEISFDRFTSKFNIEGGKIVVKDGMAEGPFFDFKIRGDINLLERRYNLKGEVIPSLYGISWFVKKVPIVSRIISGSKNRGLLTPPFSIKDKY